MHSWVLARSDRGHAWELFKDALESDLSDVQGGTTAEGIHLGAMAGTVDLVQRGQTALEIVDGVLHLSPCMPQELQGMRLTLFFQGSRLDAEVSSDKVVLSAPEDWAGPKKIGVSDRVHAFKAGDRLEFDCHLHGGGWRPLTHKVTRKTEGGAARANARRRASRGREESRGSQGRGASSESRSEGLTSPASVIPAQSRPIRQPAAGLTVA